MISKAPFTLTPLLLGWLLRSRAYFQRPHFCPWHCKQLNAPLPHSCKYPRSSSFPAVWLVAPGSRIFLEPSVKLFRSAGQVHTLCHPPPSRAFPRGTKATISLLPVFGSQGFWSW